MFKRVTAAAVCAALSLTLFAGCRKATVEADEADVSLTTTDTAVTDTVATEQPVINMDSAVLRDEASDVEDDTVQVSLDAEILYFTADTEAIRVGVTAPVVFTAEFDTEVDLSDYLIAVFTDEGTFVCYLFDDGNTGDEEAGDGIFTMTARLHTNVAKTVSYYVCIATVGEEAEDGRTEMGDIVLEFPDDVVLVDFNFETETRYS